MKYDIDIESRWKNKKKSQDETYNSFKLIEYNIEELNKMVEEFTERRNFSYLLNASKNLEKSLDEGTVVYFKNNKPEEDYIGVVDVFRNKEIQIKMICKIENLYNMSSSDERKIKYFESKDEVNVEIDCSGITPSATMYNNSKVLKSNRNISNCFEIGVLGDSFLCDVFECETDYNLSLI